MVRPQNVSLAIHLQWVVVVMSVVSSLMDPKTINVLHASQSPLGTMLSIMIKLFFMFFLTYRLSSGKNRARWQVLIICLGTLPQLLHLTIILSASFIAGVVTIFQGTLQAVILLLVFTPPANAWFTHKGE